MFKEVLTPNVAKTLAGPRYKPENKYELITTDEGFQLIVTDKSTGEQEVTKLEPEDPNEGKIRSLFEPASLSKKVDLFRVVMYVLVALGSIVIIGVILWRSNTLDPVLHWLAGLMGKIS